VGGDRREILNHGRGLRGKFKTYADKHTITHETREMEDKEGKAVINRFLWEKTGGRKRHLRQKVKKGKNRCLAAKSPKVVESSQRRDDRRGGLSKKKRQIERSNQTIAGIRPFGTREIANKNSGGENPFDSGGRVL